MILNEFNKSMEKLVEFKQKLEDMVKNLRNKAVNIEDLNNINNPEFKAFIELNLIEWIIT